MKLARKILHCCMALTATLACTWVAAQGQYPDKPIKIVVPYPPGGTSDNVTRIVAARMSEKLGQTIIIDNRGGAGTITGTVMVANSKADGYTLLATSTPLAINQSLYKSLPYRIPQDITPVSVMATVPLVMIVNPSSEAKTVEDLIKIIKDKPGELTYGSSGNGGSPHLSMEMFLSRIDGKMIHVPYKGSAPAVLDLVGGQTDVVVDTLFLTQQQVSAGRARALAQLGVKRSSLLPDVPTLQEAGLEGFDVSSWFMLTAPGGTPPAILELLNAAVNEAVTSDAVREAFAKQGLEPVGGSVADAEQFLKDQIERFGAAVKRSGLQPG
jgi:tripartite-type tricarboxylate transporter receptor subunit TctC